MDVSRNITHSVKYFIAIVLSLLFAQATFAQASENQQIVVEGTLTDTGGNAIDLSGVSLVFYVLTNDGCYLYGERSSAAGDSQGNILHRIGSSSLVVGSPNGYTQNLFFGTVSGTTTFAGNDCGATAASVRLVQVYYEAENIRANLNLGTVPYAHNATMLNGKNAADFLQVTNDSNTLFYGGSSGQFLSKTASGTLAWTTSSLSASSITAALGYTPANSASAGSVTNITAGPGLSGGTINSSGTISINFGTSSGTVAAGNDSRIVGALQSVNNLGDISSATIARANLGLGNLATKSTVNLGSDVSGVLPVANGGTQWQSNAAGVMTTLNATVGSSTIYSNIGLTVMAPSYTNPLTAYFNNTASDGNGVKINVDNTSPAKYGLKVSTTGNLTTNFIVLNSGNVGVGTASPMTSLDVSGAIRVGMISAICDTSYAGSIRYNSGLVEYCNGTVWNSLANMSEIKWSSSGSDLYYSSGNVGIGTTTPASKFHVFSSGSEIARFDGNSSGSYVTFANSGTDKGFFGYGSGSTMFTNGVTTGMMLRSESHIYLGSQNQAHLMVHTTGKVGVGTLSPTRELTVSGVVRASGGVEFGDGSVQNTSAWGGIQHINANCSAANECMVTCPGSKKIVTGGCLNSATGTIAPLISSYPSSTTQWNCKWGTGALAVSAFAICTDM